MKKQAWHHYIIQIIFYFLEDHFPKFTYKINFFSKIDKFTDLNPSLISNVNIKFFQKKYSQALALIKEKHDLGKFVQGNKEIKVLNYIVSDFFLVGSNKSPIRKISANAMSSENINRIKWGNAFPSLYSKCKFINGHIIYIPDIENYYHIMVDHILPPLLYVVKNREKINSITFVTKRRLHIIEVFCSLLRSKNIFSSIYQIKTHEKIFGNFLIYSVVSSPHESVVFAYKEIFDYFSKEIDQLIENINIPERVYISRNLTKRRNLLNENEIFNKLENLNFERVIFNGDNTIFQIAIFRKSKIIISVHGAALTNICWAKACNIIAITPGDIIDFHYLHMSSQYDLDYTLIKGTGSQTKQNFTADVDTILNAIVLISDN